METGQELHRLKDNTVWVNRAAFSPDGGLVVLGCEDNTVRLWAAATGEVIRTLSGHTGAVGSVYQIQYITDLAQTNDASAWRGGTVTLRP